MAIPDDWAPDACTLPTVERPLRVAEFDDLFTAVRRSERPQPTRFHAKSHASTWIASIGTALLAIGISGIATGTLGDLLHGTSRLVLIDITPFQAMTIAATGWLLLRSSVSAEPALVGRVSSTPLPGA